MQAIKQARKQASDQASMQARKLFGTSRPNFSQICSEIMILAHLTKLSNQPTNRPLSIVRIALTQHFSNQRPIGRAMLNFSQNHSEITIIVQLAKLTNQPTTFHSQNSLNSPFFKIGAIENTPTIFQPNRKFEPI